MKRCDFCNTDDGWLVTLKGKIYCQKCLESVFLKIQKDALDKALDKISNK